MGARCEARRRRDNPATGVSPARGGLYRPRNPRASPLWRCATRHGKELREAGRLRRTVERQVIERFIECGDPHHGFARIYCDACGHDYLLAYSCKTRYFCPSCHQKRVLLYGEWVEENVLAAVPHRQYVFTLPRLLRPIFGRHRPWLGELCRIAARLLVNAYAGAAPSARLGLILFVQTFGDLANFNPHVHVLAADGAFLADGTFVALPPVPEELLVERFRRAVLEFLAQNDAISEDLRSKLLGWRYSGFSAHNQVRVGGDDAEGRKKLAGYMLRAPMSLEKMSYDAETGTVIYRSRMHAGLKRNFQVMPGAEWLELLCRHIPDRYEHMVRYVGWYSNRARGERAKVLQGQETTPMSSAAPVEPMSEFAARAKAAWARLIRKVYDADPLECPRCKGPMRVIALIDDPASYGASSSTWDAGRQRRASAARPFRTPSGRRDATVEGECGDRSDTRIGLDRFAYRFDLAPVMYLATVIGQSVSILHTIWYGNAYQLLRCRVNIWGCI